MSWTPLKIDDCYGAIGHNGGKVDLWWWDRGLKTHPVTEDVVSHAGLDLYAIAYGRIDHDNMKISLATCGATALDVRRITKALERRYGFRVVVSQHPSTSWIVAADLACKWRDD